MKLKDVIASAYKHEFESSSDINVSHEMIAPQHNDWIVPVLDELYGKIVTHLETNHYRADQYLEFFKNAEVRKILSEIEATYKKRFGWNFHIIASDTTHAAVFTSFGPKHKTVMQRMSSITKDLKYLEKKSAKARGNIKDRNTYRLDGIIGGNYDKLVVKQFVDNHKALENVYNTSGVKIDNKKAYISGLPEEFCTMMFCNFMLLVRTGLTGRHINAIMMHEVGHAFTYLSLEYKTIETTQMLYENMIDVLGKKGGTRRDAIIHTYAKLNPNAVDKIEKMKKSEKGEEIAVMELSKDYLRTMLSSGKHPVTDSENLADAFCTAMGLGTECAEALKKIRDEIGWQMVVDAHNPFTVMTSKINPMTAVYPLWRTICIFFWYRRIVMMYNRWVLIIFCMMTGLIPLYALAIVANCVYTEFWSAVLNPGFKLIFGGGGRTYDDDYKRVAHIRKNTIRYLKTGTDLPLEDKKVILNDLTRLDELEAAEHNLISGVSDDIVFAIQKFFSKNFRLQEFEDSIEKLQNNELYVNATKLAVAFGVEELSVEEIADYLENLDLSEIYTSY